MFSFTLPVFMLLEHSKRRWGPHAFIKQRSITSRHNTKPTQNTTHTKKLPMILDSAKVLALSWGASQWECQRRTSSCGTICRLWGVGQLVQLEQGLELAFETKCWPFWKTYAGTHLKAPFCLWENNNLKKKYGGLIFKNVKYKAHFHTKISK